jgi:ferric-dicitrate binding protein FerR (iron transport regulator)
MKEEFLIKWLNNELTPNELELFENSSEYHSYVKILDRAKRFKAPEFDTTASFEKLDFGTYSSEKSTKGKLLKYIVAIAAVLVIGFTLFNSIGNPSDIHSFETSVAKTEKIELPDHSIVNLNANSSINYSSTEWETERQLLLVGEALFEVEKGRKFTVNTHYGNIQVLGTVFNVKSRDYSFEVTCFEGSVKVEVNDASFVLKQNDKLSIEDSQVVVIQSVLSTPDWKTEQSIIKSKSLDLVLKEFKNYYDVEFETSNINTSKIYTGSFGHDNLKIALNSITLPLGLSYKIDGGTILLSNK